MKNKNKIKYSTIVAFIDNSYNCQISTFKEKITFEEFKDNIKYAFSKGVIKVKLYKDYRKKNDFLEIRKEDFSLDEILSGYENIQLKNKIELLEKRIINNVKSIENLEKSIEFFKNNNDKIKKEIISLSVPKTDG
jgi:hypothetical protein